MFMSNNINNNNNTFQWQKARKGEMIVVMIYPLLLANAGSDLVSCNFEHTTPWHRVMIITNNNISYSQPINNCNIGSILLIL